MILKHRLFYILIFLACFILVSPVNASMFSIMDEAGNYNYDANIMDVSTMMNTGYGNSFAMSDYIYAKATAEGLQVRIIEYYPGNIPHRTVQRLINSLFYVDFGFYSKLKPQFQPTINKPSMKVIRTN